jgi:bifunctional non-homologous end joining protein LigD
MARSSKLPKRLQPMLATLIDAPFDGPDWVFENKWDGFRVVAYLTRGRVTLYSRSGIMLSDSYRAVADALRGVPHDAVLDGEVVALDARGIARFQLLQNAHRTRVRLRYYLFDLMLLDEEDLRPLPLLARKERLRRLVPRHPLLAFSAHHAEFGRRFFAAAARRGLEGIMAKRANSPYLSGVRSTDWLKIKAARRQEVVIVGFTAPRGSRPYFGSLLLAVREADHWRYVGRVGTGFSHEVLRRLYARLRPLRRRTSPLPTVVKNARDTRWVEPTLVAEVKFAEWTTAGEMRQPAFVGLREDKRPEEVIREGGVTQTRR